MMSNIPSHVPSGAVVDFDYFDQPGFSADPYDVVTSLFESRTPRIIFTPKNGGHWVIGGYKEIFDAARDTAIFSSTSMQIPAMADEPKLIPLNMDPPEHTIYRALLSQAFAPDRVEPLEDEIRDLTRDLINNVVDKGEAEFVSEVSEPLPVLIFMRVIGLPAERYRVFRDNVKKFLSDPSSRAEVMQFLDKELGDLISQKLTRRDNDLLSIMVDAEISGRPPTFDELLGFCRLLVFAGLDTVTNAISLGIRHLASDCELQAQLRSQPSLVPTAVEELLRRYSFANMGRLVLHDIEFHGLAMRKGDRVLFMPAGAGLDPAVYPEPERLALDRRERVLPAFGFGRHRCVGMHLARLELKILYEEWLNRIPTFSLCAAKPPTFHGGVVIGLERLHLEWS